ncbi:hypothetical protein Lepto7375DRAFT_1830 [Leptolyngbya sp. PCC 7375]|nr:hypothetical protein Lepto7375DRAFT_1830 [Leptolyngbya sp. PCC 7375]
MPSQPPRQPIGSTLALGFIDPQTQEFVSTASLTVLPNGVIEFKAISDIPKGSVGYLPTTFIPQPLSPQQPQTTTFSSFDHP